MGFSFTSTSTVRSQAAEKPWSLELSENEKFLRYNWHSFGTADSSLPASVTQFHPVGTREEDANLVQIFLKIPAEATGLDLHNFPKKPVTELVQAFAHIPLSITHLDLTNNTLYERPDSELTQIFEAIPRGVTSLYLCHNKLHYTLAEPTQIFAKIPATVTTLDLSNNGFGYVPKRFIADSFVQALSEIPSTVTTLNLSGNNLDKMSSSRLVHALQAIKPTVTKLNLRSNDLSRISGTDLAEIFAAIPPGVTELDLQGNNLSYQPSAKLAQAFAAIPAGVKVNYGNDELHKKYDIHRLLASYLDNRRGKKDSSGDTKEYFHGSFFSTFQKSFKQKEDAVHALESALRGDKVDLSVHLSTLRNGNLGKQLRAFVKAGMGKALVGKPVNTVSDFVQALQEKNARQLRPASTPA